ncbi:agamous-like MADS-box protein AGL61 [Durio zibethinus]|uniref:Agamous-like MADS-box protein AGL61 n=1 Tax=Durio zibethinus TaxID=66656 RepID=A0A6P5YGC9_DURZI|nr:agamous-like MADS-box protein AGL61 [Durio zibethinus]
MEDNVLMSNATEAKKTRSSRGRQRIEIKKLEDESKRQVTFSKRRRGLFNKAKELSTLCGAEVGILTLSKSRRVYTNDNVEAVLDRYLAESSGQGNYSWIKQKEVKEDISGGFWLDQPIENMGLVELLEYAMALNDLRKNAEARVEELSIQKSTCLWQYVADQELNKAQFLQQLMVGGNYDWFRDSDNFTPVEHRY